MYTMWNFPWSKIKMTTRYDHLKEKRPTFKNRFLLPLVCFFTAVFANIPSCLPEPWSCPEHTSPNSPSPILSCTSTSDRSNCQCTDNHACRCSVMQLNSWLVEYKQKCPTWKRPYDCVTTNGTEFTRTKRKQLHHRNANPWRFSTRNLRINLVTYTRYRWGTLLKVHIG